MSSRILLAATILAFLIQMPIARAEGDTMFWEGELLRGDVAAPMRLQITERDSAPTATLDLPNLVYAEEPAAIAGTADGYIVTLPFGLEDFTLRRTGATLTGSRGDFSVRLRQGPPAPFTHETISIPVDGATLTGDLYTPADRHHPRAAIVVAGGSTTQGARVGWNTRSWCDFIVRRGILCLVYPRRPDIENGIASTLRRDGDDLLAAARLLAARPGVDRSRVGVFGRSRGVWIAVEAASRDPLVSFLVISGVPATTPSDQDIHSLVYRLRRDGVAEADIADAVAYERLYFSVAQTGRNWPALAAEAARAQSTRWGEYVDQPLSLDDLVWWRANGGYDPTRAFRGLRIPVYAFWGGNDAVTPPSVHLPLLQTLMADNTRLETRVFPGGDHRGEVSPGFDADRRWQWFAMAPGTLDTLSAWLEMHGYSAPPTRRRR
jgi:pimeloyl-ACP methyl ester carboxylesterase